MFGVDDVAGRVGSIGFSCQRCGACCRRIAEDSNLVIVSPAEIRVIMAATGMAWDEVAEPYPDFIDAGNGGEYTLAWCIRRTADACIFLCDGRCSIYAHRPWICRTYPFMLVDDGLLVSECPGLGKPISLRDAQALGADLCRRQAAEAAEEAGLRIVYERSTVSPGTRAVIDSEGMKVVHD
ncbi:MULTISPECIES: YkgJ family cysteine cluster protein [unclassified Methanoculleus]|uniref:YkgJ family cysteine cluster protein n=1 Tax=unclassified Methanoculleus TaxID=2619537 RepID=UPI0025EF1037|nr:MULTISPECIES: YkgJ family cysteine cluster protein [unclassified Methanoculleus]MCK9318694.1 YkgJ family cysteine cluster protein [Methanoculleus sp.]MDD2254461.1 YkgJ family cysteine cluster protein [Methanoculleus sp.]MDD2787388.1 YkgJ family cysteine cluster protein [Methanoculleus sp.]MDD3216692.1 YkgJ family cysteine cluster protein [Methanoculleus sp.]MDD4315069.1 YkgJ family cysteine cluster protein [Methanoculleus sp.]